MATLEPKMPDPLSDGLLAVRLPEARRTWKLRRVLPNQDTQQSRRAAR